MGKRNRIAKVNRVVSKGLRQGINDSMASPLTGMDQDVRAGKRGLQIYTLSQLIATQGRIEGGGWAKGTFENPYFFLTPEERVRIAQLCTPIMGVVTSRMHRVAGTRWIITPDKRNDDKIIYEMETKAELYKELSERKELKYQIAARTIFYELGQKMPDLFPDMTNFKQCVLRWRRKIMFEHKDRGDEIAEWLQEPNQEDKWSDFIRKYVFDLMIHGSVNIYKEDLNGKVENLFLLSGGTVMPLKDKYVGGTTAYIQIIDGVEPQIYFQNELCFVQYVPTSMRAYGLVPIEALINKVAETMLFDKLMADRADGTRPPEKMIIINDASPFGDVDKELAMPLNPDEQRRIEEKINRPISGGIMTFTGNGATVVDLSRSDTISAQMQRQKDIREEVAMVFNMSNMEVNLTGGDDTSGRSTSEAQSDIDMGKGIVPILKQIETKFNREILPFRFGHGYSLQFETSKSEEDELRKYQLKLQTGLYSVNEIRTKDLNENPFPGEQFDSPQGAQAAQPGQDQQNPMFTKETR